MDRGITSDLLIALGTSTVVAIFANFSFVKGILISTFKGAKSVHFAWAVFFLAILDIGKIQTESLLINNIPQVVMVSFAGAVVLWNLSVNIGLVSRATVPIVCLMLYGFSGIVSGFYSSFPSFSLYKGTLVVLSTCFCLIVLSYKPQYAQVEKFVDFTYMFYALLMLSFVVGGILWPELSLEYKPGMILHMLSGFVIRVNPNTVGYIAGTVGLILVNRGLQQLEFRSALFIVSSFLVSVFVLLLAQSRTCIAGFAISAGFLLVIRRKVFHILGLATLVGVLLLVGGLDRVTQTAEQYYKRGQSDKVFESWSGRKEAWAVSWSKFKEAPILGYGMGSGVRFGDVSRGLKGSHLHSSYFEVLLDSGLLGFFPWIFCLVSVANNLFRKAVFPPSWFTVEIRNRHLEITAIFLFSVIRSIAGTTFVLFDYTFIVYIAVIAYSGAVNNLANRIRFKGKNEIFDTL
jgi:O-antigen ligase